MDKTVEGCGFVCIDHIQKGEFVISDIGGTCANVLSILSFLGWNSSVWIPLYEDERLSYWLCDRRVRTEYFAKTKKRLPEIIQIQDQTESTHYFITRCPRCGHRLAETYLPTKKHVKTDKKSPSFFFCDRISEGILSRAEETANSGGITMYEPNGLRTYNQLLTNCSQFHIIKFSDDKVSENWQLKLLNDLKDKGVKLIIITKGARGLKFAAEQRWEWSECDSINCAEIADSSGAGDWLTAVFMDCFITKIDSVKNEFDYGTVRSCLQSAIKAAVLSCKETGAQGILHNRHRIHELEVITGRQLPDMIPVHRVQGGLTCPYCGERMGNR